MKHLKSILLILVGEATVGFAMNLFLLPYHMAPGGLTSLADVLSSLSALSVGTWIFILNVPLFVMGLRIIGKDFFFKSLLGMILNSVMVDLFARIPLPTSVFENDLILCSLFGGLLVGFGYGLALYAGGSSGGTDIGGSLIKHKKPTIKLGRAILICDLTLILVQSIVYANLKMSLYAVVTLYISSRVVDLLNEGGQASKFAYIISDRGDAIAQRIMAETGRGVTRLIGTGMFTNETRPVYLCTMHKQDLTVIKGIIREIDPAAFVVINDAREVNGNGFYTDQP